MSYLDPLDKAAWKSRIEACKSQRQLLVLDWADNVNFRRGKPFQEDTDSHRVNVNLDWSLTKAKLSQLFTAVPTVAVTAKRAAYDPAAGPFSKVLNHELTMARVGNAVTESIIDAINASGIGAVICGYERRTEEIDIPLAYANSSVMADLPTTKTKRTTAEQFYIRRISPADLLWPVDFTGSDFDDAPFIGRSGRMSWAEAVHNLGLTDDQKDRACSNSSPSTTETIRQDINTQQANSLDIVSYDEIYYWRYLFDPAERYYKSIYRIVFVDGLEEPVIDEPWKGQQFDQTTGTFVGATKFPIRIITLSYISDDAIPPSDTAIGRPQVLEIIKSRTQMILQREHSIPLRWFDVNAVDPAIQENLQRGTWQGFIPMQGDGSRRIGEVARASYPSEDIRIIQQAEADLNKQWQLGANQMGNFASGERSAREASIVQSNAQTLIGYEKSRVEVYFVGIAEVMAGLISLYSDFAVLGDDEKQRLLSYQQQSPQLPGPSAQSKLSVELAFSILPDSTILFDSHQQTQRLMGILNMIGKSGLIDPLPLIKKICELNGLDFAELAKQPEPPKPDPPNISIRNAEDIMNPIMLGLLMKSGQAPGPQDLMAAEKVIGEAARFILAGPSPMMNQQPPMMNQQGQPGPQQLPQPGPSPNPDWNMMERIDRRTSAD